MRWRLALVLLLAPALVDAAEVRSRVALAAASETLEVVAAPPVRCSAWFADCKRVHGRSAKRLVGTSSNP